MGRRYEGWWGGAVLPCPSRAPVRASLALPKPSSRHTTVAAFMSQLSSHTVPHRPFFRTSTRPSPITAPPLRRTKGCYGEGRITHTVEGLNNTSKNKTPSKVTGKTAGCLATVGTLYTQRVRSHSLLFQSTPCQFVTYTEYVAINIDKNNYFKLINRSFVLNKQVAVTLGIR